MEKRMQMIVMNTGIPVDPDRAAADATLYATLAAGGGLDESSGDRTLSVGSLTLVDNNTVTSDTGLVYPLASEYLAANNEYLSLADNAAVDLGTGDFWLALFVYPTVATTLQFLWSKRADATNYVNLLITAGDAIQFESKITNVVRLGAITTTSLPYFIGYWNMILFTADRDSAGNTRIFVNNKDRTTGTSTVSATNIDNTGALEVGKWGGGTTANFTGLIGPLLLGKGRIPTALEIWWLCNNGAGRTIAALADGIPAHSRRVLCQGDSLTWGFGIAAGQTYPHQLKSGLDYRYLVVSCAVNGNRIDAAAADATQIDTVYNASITKNILVVWLGTNDLANGVSAADAYNALVAYCQARQAAGWSVIVCTCLPRSDVDIAAARATYNASITTNWATFADALANVAADPALDDAADFADGVHLNSSQAGAAATVIRAQVITL